MTGTGCDIVALKAINVDRTKQANFYSKIIITAEKSLYDEALSAVVPFEHFVWLAWSVKESVYKFLQRGNPDLVFSPSKINIKQLTVPAPIPSPAEETEGQGFDNNRVYSGFIMYGDQQFYSRSTLNNDLIFSVVNDVDDFTATYWGIKKIDSSEPDVQSAAVRIFILNSLNSLFPGEGLRIEKSPYGYPMVLQNDTELPVIISFAHHDLWVAYSFVLNS